MNTQPTVVARVGHAANVVIEHDHLIGLGIPRAVAAHVVASAALRAVQDYGTLEISIEPGSNNVIISCKSTAHAEVVATAINTIPSLAIYVRAALSVLGCTP